MEIYQGEPLSYLFKELDDEGQYVPSLEGRVFEAMMVDEYGKPVKSWSTATGTIRLGSMVKADGTVVGYAAFDVKGTKTAELYPGKYSLEMSEVLSSDGRAIGIAQCIVHIKPSRIKRGIQL